MENSTLNNKNIGLKPETLAKIISTLTHFPEIEGAILYGSRAKGNYKPGSDIDICLKGQELNLSTIAKLETEIDDLLLPYTIDITVYHKIDNPDLTEHINRVGISLYKKP